MVLGSNGTWVTKHTLPFLLTALSCPHLEADLGTPPLLLLSAMVLTSPSCFQEGKKLSRSLAELAFGSQMPAPKVMGRKGWKHTAQGEGARPIARGDNSPNLMGLSSFLVEEWWRLGNAQLEPHSPALHSPCGPGVLSLWVPKRSGPPQALHIYQGGSCLSSFLVFLHQQE